MSPALHPPERPSHTHSPKPAGFGGSGHEKLTYLLCTLTLITMWVHLSPCGYTHHQNQNTPEALIELSSIELYMRGFRVMSQTIVSGREPPSYWCTLTIITMWVHLSPKPEHARSLNRIKFYRAVHAGISGYVSINSIGERATVILVYTYTYHHVGTLITMWVHLSPKPEHARSLNRIKFYRAVHAGISGYVSNNSIGERATVILVYTNTYHHAGTLITKTRTRY